MTVQSRILSHGSLFAQRASIPIEGPYSTLKSRLLHRYLLSVEPLRKGRELMSSWKRLYVLLAAALFMLTSFVVIRPARAIFLDDTRTIQLSGVFYNQLRLRTTDTRRYAPHASDWTMLQHRYFVDPQILVQVQPWLRRFPFGEELVDSLHIEDARFFFNPRFEYDGVYDYGPDVYRDRPAPRFQKANRLQLFEVYGDFRLLEFVNLRIGRQNLSWGETDAFRLLDRINPLDNGFGGFLIPLDERRRPLMMVRATIGLGDYPQWDIYNTALETFFSPDKRLPAGAPSVTPWGVTGATLAGFPPTRAQTLGDFGLTAPVATQADRPDISMKDSRMGVRLMWTWSDISFSLAYMSTYPDAATPTLRLAENRGTDAATRPFLPGTKLLFPNVQIAGMTATTPLTALNLNYTVLRTEVAGFFGEPFFIESQNFRLGVPVPKRDVIRAMVGFDHNQWLRALNPGNTFTFTGQIFFTGIQGGVGGIQIPLQRKPGKYIDVDRTSYVSTFGVNTLYSAGHFFNISQVQPSVNYLYDWEGAWLLQPGVTFIRDPFRFRIEFNYLEGRFIQSTGSGIGLFKDKDNLAFRIDYLL
jgi:hypothetical protein